MINSANTNYIDYYSKISFNKLKSIIIKLLQKKDPISSIKILENVFNLFSSQEGIRYLLGISYWQYGDLFSAKEILNKEIEFFSQSSAKKEAHQAIDNIDYIINNLNLKKFTYWKKFPRKYDEMIIIMNGPSLDSIIEDIILYREKADILVCNFTAQTDFFQSIRPDIYMLVDPNFFLKKMEKLDRLYNILNNINWDMYLYVPYPYIQHASSLVYNKRIRLCGIPIDIIPPRASKIEKSYYFLSGNAGFGMQNVLIPSLSIAILSMYDKCWIAGADNDYIKNFYIDRHCRFFFSIDHCNNIGNIKQQADHSMYKQLCCQANLYNQLESLSDYSSFSSTKIINLSIESMYDMFPKGHLGKKPYEHIRNKNLFL